MLAKVISSITVLGVFGGLWFWGIINEPAPKVLTTIQEASLLSIAILAFIGTMTIILLLCNKIWGK